MILHDNRVIELDRSSDWKKKRGARWSCKMGGVPQLLLGILLLFKIVTCENGTGKLRGGAQRQFLHRDLLLEFFASCLLLI